MVKIGQNWEVIKFNLRLRKFLIRFFFKLTQEKKMLRLTFNKYPATLSDKTFYKTLLSFFLLKTSSSQSQKKISYVQIIKDALENSPFQITLCTSIKFPSLSMHGEVCTPSCALLATYVLSCTYDAMSSSKLRASLFCSFLYYDALPLRTLVFKNRQK